MLNRVTLETFKCFENLKLPLSSLTLLTGFNSAGKSTVLQAIGTLHQTVTENEWANELILNGPIVSLGTVRDVVNEIQGGRGFGIGVDTEEASCFWAMETLDTKSLTIPVRHIKWDSQVFDVLPDSESSSFLRFLLPQDLLSASTEAKKLGFLLNSLEYISAERSGPRDIYPMGSQPSDMGVGLNGEKTPWVLYQNSDKTVLEGMLFPGNPNPYLQSQVKSWLNIFFPGADFSVSPVQGANLVSLGLRMTDTQQFRRPKNVGYGLSHILPIITACLASSKDRVLLIENPEAHLHPSGQSLMGTFIAQAVSAGVQIIVETHSDHVLNGVRKAVKNHILSRDKVAIHFFSPSVKDQVISPLIDQRGNLDAWPQGFFDQFDIDTSSLIGWDVP
jgi:predicted ATPase